MPKKAVLSASTLVLIAVLTSCAAVQKYHPVPLSPAETVPRLESRTLVDAGLRSFIEGSLGHSVFWPPAAWSLRMLTLAAFYFNPNLAVARAKVQTARAGIETAKMRPNPVLEFSPGVPSPYLAGLSLAFPILTAGKRKHEIKLAENLEQVAQLNLAQAAWQVRSGVRRALLQYLSAQYSLNLARSQQRLWSTRAARLSQEFTGGEIASSQATMAKIGNAKAQLATVAVQGQVLKAKAALAGAIGIPVLGLQNVTFTWPELDRVPSDASLTARQIQRDAIINRLDVRQALAEYRAAQTALQLEIARRDPNFQLGPGYEYEESSSFFAPVLSLPLPIFNRNQGPIAQAKARRQEAAARLMAIQAGVIAQSEQALAQYVTGYRQLQTAQAVVSTLRHVQLPMLRQEVNVGEMDWLALNSARLQTSTAAQAWVNSIFQTQAALGQLEEAVQRPLEPADRLPEQDRGER